jgi:hypothetical protein
MLLILQRLAVGILVSGFAFDEEDFWKPWEGWKDNLEKYGMYSHICFMNPSRCNLFTYLTLLINV